MSHYRIRTYEIKSRKIKNREVRLHFLSDLHGLSFAIGDSGKSELAEQIQKRSPDVILIGGDMIIGSVLESTRCVEKLVEELGRIAPVYYALGNHEQARSRAWHPEAEEYVDDAFFAHLRANTCLLDNCNAGCEVYGNKLQLYGLSLGRDSYRKPFPRKIRKADICALLGERDSGEQFQILLAHSPYHANAYFAWGADLTLCGHYHGGVVRFGENAGLLSTYGHPFPRYCCGRFDKGSRTLIVSGGLGEHTVNLRIHNPREIIEICLCPE